jgi:hypothetical protein
MNGQDSPASRAVGADPLGRAGPTRPRQTTRIRLLLLVLGVMMALNLADVFRGPVMPADTQAQESMNGEQIRPAKVNARMVRAPWPEVSGDPFSAPLAAASRATHLAAAAAPVASAAPMSMQPPLAPLPQPMVPSVASPPVDGATLLGRFEDQKGAAAFVVFNGQVLKLRLGDSWPGHAAGPQVWSVDAITEDTVTLRSDGQPNRSIRAGEPS